MKHIAVSIQYSQTMCHANMLVPIYVHFSCLVTAELESVLVLSQLNCVETPTRISAHNSCCGLYKISFQLIFHLFSLECKNAKTAQKSSHNFHLWPVLYLCATLVRIGWQWTKTWCIFFSIDLRNNAFLINEGASVAALKCFKIDEIVCLKKKHCSE